MVITDLKLTDATNHWPPGQFADDLTLVDKRIEIHAVRLGPAVGGRGCENRLFVSNIGMLEGELPHAEIGKRFDVAPHQGLAVDVPARHYASGAHGDAIDHVKESAQSWCRFAHQAAVRRVIKMMS